MLHKNKNIKVSLFRIKKNQEVLKFPIDIFWNLDPEMINKIISKQFGLWNPEPKKRSIK